MKTRLTALTLLTAAMVLAGCSEKRDETTVAFALNDVRLAAMQAEMKRADADRRDATAADGVEYSKAIEALAAAERAAMDKLATREEIRIRRQLGETEGKKSVENIATHLRKYR